MIVFKEIQIEDAKNLNNYINDISKENTFTYLSGEKISLNEDINFIKNSLKNKDFCPLPILIFKNQEMIGLGIITIFGKELQKGKHKASFKISIKKEYRGIGLGKELLYKIIEKIIASGFEIIDIDVFSNNTSAIMLYKYFGFKVYGEMVDAYFDKKNNIYTNKICMCLHLKNYSRRLTKNN